MKNLKSEMKASVDSMKDMASAEDLAAKKTEILGRQIEAGKQKIALLQGEYDRAKNKLDDLGKALEDAKREFGENSDEALKAQNAYNKQAKAVNDLGTQLNNATADVNRMTKELDEVGDEAKETGKELEDAGKSGKVFGDTMKGVVTGELIAKGLEKIAQAAKKAVSALKDAAIEGAKYADEIVTLSAKTGIATDTLQEYQYMSELVDVSVETLTGSMKKLTNNMDSARSGSGNAANAFARLGVSVTDAKGELRDNEEVFAEVITALGEMTNETERDALAMDIFGKSAQDLNPLIKAGGDEIQRLADEAHRMGYVLDAESLESLLAVSDAMERMKNVVTTVKNELAVALAPVIQMIADKLTALVQRIDWDKVGEKLGNLLTFIIDHYKAVGIGLGVIAAGFLAVSIAASPLTLIAAAILAIVAATTAAIIGLQKLGEKLGLEGEEADKWRETHYRASQDVAKASIETSAAMGQAFGQMIETSKYGRDQISQASVETSTAMGQAFTGAADVVKGAFEDIKGFGQSLKDNLKEAARIIGEDFANMKNSVIASVDKVKAKAAEMAGNIKAKFQEAVDAIKALPQQVYQIGANIVTGLWNGIKDKFTWLVNQIKSFAKNVVDQLKGFFGIHSPSTVMRDEIGENLALGIASGITAGLPAIRGALDKVTDASLASGIMAPAPRVTAPDLERVGSGIVNGISTGAAGSGGMRIEVPLVINGREFARAVLSDFRAVDKASPAVAYG